MSSSRAESQVSHLGRARAGTAQSVYRNLPPAPPLQIGATRILTTWVHDPDKSPIVSLNPAYWPGVTEGDMLSLSSTNEENPYGFLFIVAKDESPFKHQMQQISVPRPVAEKFGLRNNGEVSLVKVDKDEHCADYIELVFQDQYLGRNEMWRLGSHLVGQCVYLEQEISFIGVIGAKVQSLYIGGTKVSAAYVTSSTKAVYRSLSAKVTIFIQVCRELWEFAGDGERYNEKIVHSFLPALFNKWREAGTNHIVTIVLISRVHYDESEIDYAAGPLRQDSHGRWFKDFFKVINDLEVLYDWKVTLVSLKDSFWDFQRDILLTHHYHRSALISSVPPTQVRLVGQLSYAHDGPILEALNLALNPSEMHYIDRSLSLTGISTIIVTPGTGYFRVSKPLLRLTTTRLLDQGFAVDLVSLAKPPLHQSPIFAFQGNEPEIRPETAGGKGGARSLDPLWGGDDDSNDTGREKPTFWWEPFWMSVSFWDRQMDLPFRADRFVARAKMHEIEMLGLLDHDVLSSIEIPCLPDVIDPSATPMLGVHGRAFSKVDADKFDMDTFALPSATKSVTSRNSLASSGSVTTGGSLHSSDGIRRSLSTRSSEAARIPTIEESPHREFDDLPLEIGFSDSDTKYFSKSTLGALSTSPSQSSIRSIRSTQSTLSLLSATTPQQRERRPSASRSSTKSRFNPSWLFGPFRSGISQPQTSPVSASGVTSPSSPLATSVSHVTAGASVSAQNPVLSARPVAIKRSSSTRAQSRNIDRDAIRRGSTNRNSPVSTPPRDDSLPIVVGKRRSGTLSSMSNPMASSSPILKINPSKPLSSVPSPQSSLARRWQHMFPQPLSRYDIKWKSMVTPGCLPLSVEYLPSISELESSYDVFSYDFVVDPPDMRSFLVRPPRLLPGMNSDRRRAEWALVVMRGMVAQRLAQGFQFVLRGPAKHVTDGPSTFRRSKSMLSPEEEIAARPAGASDILRTANDAVYLSMSNEIHRVAYSGDSIQVRRYVRRMPRVPPFQYTCLIWPKQGVGYTELQTSFGSHGLENYGWNRLDMLVAGYENQFSESIRYWRTRFVVIPTETDEVITVNVGPNGEELNAEETRLLGMQKLAEIFSRVRWQHPEDKESMPPIRFLPTDLDPSFCILDESITAQLDEIHAAGPLHKNINSQRDISEMSLAAIAKAMREEDGVPIKDHKWHARRYPNSFTGAEFVSWLVREFRDVSSKEQAAEWGAKLLQQGLFEHCRGAHGFLDGHYFYVMKGEYVVPTTPRGGWFRSARHVSVDDVNARTGFYPSSTPRPSLSIRKTKKRLILSQSMPIDIDPNKRSDQAECVILHHDIIHNPANCFHFELQWIGTTARCIDDLLRQWSRGIEKYGLKLVEAYVTQISDIRDRNPFQSCFPLPLALPPPIVPDLEQRIPDGAHHVHYFEYALLRRFEFVLDIEAAGLYPDRVDVVYSYRREPFKYSQWVHRSGAAFIQVLGGSQGFLFLKNRLMAPGRLGAPGTTPKSQRPGAAAEELRVKLHQFCSDSRALEAFYDDVLARLSSVLEEPPPLRI